MNTGPIIKILTQSNISKENVESILGSLALINPEKAMQIKKLVAKFLQ
jgi:TusA-related sulfurtransferase